MVNNVQMKNMNTGITLSDKQRKIYGIGTRPNLLFSMPKSQLNRNLFMYSRGTKLRII